MPTTQCQLAERAQPFLTHKLPHTQVPRPAGQDRQGQSLKLSIKLFGVDTGFNNCKACQGNSANKVNQLPTKQRSAPLNLGRNAAPAPACQKICIHSTPKPCLAKPVGCRQVNASELTQRFLTHRLPYTYVPRPAGHDRQDSSSIVPAPTRSHPHFPSFNQCTSSRNEARSTR